MKKISFIFLLLIFGFTYSSQKVSAKSYGQYQTKIVNNHKFQIYERLTRKGPSRPMANTRSLRLANYQSKLSRKVRGQRYWFLYINGHSAGWVNEKAFRRSKISVARHISLVYNPVYKFPTRDAINYVTNSHGSVISKSKVNVSAKSVSSTNIGSHVISYNYGKAHAKAIVTVRSDEQEGIVKVRNKFKPGKTQSTWKHHYKTSGNWGKSYAPETKSHKLKSGNLDLKTVFYQPATLSIGNSVQGAVGPTPEGLTVSGKRAYIAMFQKPYRQNARIVSYNLKKVPRYELQKLPWLSWNKFVALSKNIKISPLIKLGHGQSLSSTKNYLYVIANDHTLKNSFKSEEIMQIRKSDLTIKRIWTFRIWNARKKYSYYVHNAVFVNDHRFYAVFHNGRKHKFQYWQVDKVGNKWVPKQVGASQGEFMRNNSPMQGLTYDKINKNFYLAFNDYIFKIAKNGKVLSTSHFNTGREFEGISARRGKLFAELAERPELLVSPIN